MSEMAHLKRTSGRCISSTAGDRSEPDLEDRTVLRPVPPAVVEAGGRNRRVAEGLLDVGDVSAVLEGVRRHRGAKGVGPAAARIDADGTGVLSDEKPDGFGGEPGRAVGAHSPEERTVEFRAVPGRDEVRVETRERVRVDGQEAGLSALAEDLEVADAAAVVDVADVEMAELGAAQPVVQEHREDGAIAQALEGCLRGGLEQRAGLPVTERRRAAFVGAFLRPGDAVDRIDGNGVALAKVRKERRQRRELAPDGRGGELAGLERVAPGDDVRPGDVAKPRAIGEADEGGEVADRVAVDATCAGVCDVREPLGLGRDIREAKESRIPDRGGGNTPRFDPIAHAADRTTLTCENPFFRKY